VIHAILIALLAILIGLTPTHGLAAGKDFVIGLSGDATSLNPVVATDGQSYIAEWPLFDSLVELDQGLNVKPLLAESWEVSRDGLSYTFKLKRGVKWHDGKPFTARDVAFTFYSVLDPKVTTPHRAYFDALAGFPELTAKDNPRSRRSWRSVPSRSSTTTPCASACATRRARSWPCWSTPARGSFPSTSSRAPISTRPSSIAARSGPGRSSSSSGDGASAW